MAEQNTQQDLREILQIRRDKLKALQDAGMNPFEITRYDVTHHAQEVKDNFDALEGQTVSLGGRLMSKRGMGKVSFCDLLGVVGHVVAGDPPGRPPDVQARHGQGVLLRPAGQVRPHPDLRPQGRDGRGGL